MYHVADYLWMLADEPRVEAYAAAIRGVVKPGDRVLEIGAGFGFFSVLAARAGAAHVEAIETNAAIHLGPRLAADNGCGDRVRFHEADSRTVSLARTADVLIADLRGPTPFCGSSIESLIDARERLLRPGAVMIPSRDTVFIAPCAAPLTWQREVEAAHGREGLDLASVERVMYDTPIRCHIDRGDLLADGRPWITIEYTTIAGTDAAGDAEWEMTSDCHVRGAAVWFESELAPHVRLSTAPPARLSYGQMFVPFAAPVTVTAGNRLTIQIAARRAGTEYVWQWRCAVDGKTVIDQNSLAERVIDPAALAAKPRRCAV